MQQLQPPATLQDLDAALERLRGAPLLDKLAAAEAAISTARLVLGQFEARVRALELARRVQLVP